MPGANHNPDETPESPVTPEAGKVSVEEQLTQLHDQIDILADALAEKQTENDKLRADIAELLKRLYRSRSEKLEKIDPNQLLLALIFEGNEAPGEETGEAEPEAEAGIEPARPPRRKRRGHGRAILPDHLPRQVVEHSLPEAERLCPACGDPMPEIGRDLAEQLDIVPAQLRVIRHERSRYACNCNACKADPETTLITAERPSDPVGGGTRCKATPATLAAVAVDKYADHTPFYRLQDQLARRGVHIARSTMAGWMTGIAETLAPLHLAMIEAILATGYIHNDDTTVKLLCPGKGKCVTARIWGTVGTGPAPYAWFDFTNDRSTKDPGGPLDIFKLFRGYFQADAYAGYNKLFNDPGGGDDDPGIIELGCWAHARRYFVKARDSAPLPASWLLAQVQALYRVEKAVRGEPDAIRLAARRARSIPILGEIEAWMNTLNPLPKSPLGAALTYLRNQWAALQVYTTAGHLEIDNNPAENALRPIALGRKNWLFVGSPTGGKTTAVLTSFTASCRKLHIDPLAYLTDVLTRIMDHPISRIDELLPIPWVKANPHAMYVPAHVAKPH